jgi:tRNA (uracil-5-)-methyltransferase
MVATTSAGTVADMPLRKIKPEQYQSLLDEKVRRVETLYQSLDAPAAQVFASPELGFRMRAEFRIWHQGEDLFYAMFRPGDPKTPYPIEDFPIASERIQNAMPVLREALLPNPCLRERLFQVEFLSTLSGELLITLIYHRPLDEQWQEAALPLESALNARLIGRSRKQKLVLSSDHVEEQLSLAGSSFKYRQYEQGFSQPNARVNCKMIEWACQQAQDCPGDLLELYCGNGNFTLPLSRHFNSVLATEVSKTSMRAAQHNRDINGVTNLELARLSAEEVTEALAGKRVFRRLQALAKPLEDYDFSTIFVDPPRAGLDADTTALVSKFDHIIYISCNPETQVANLQQICQTHDILALALFDQFPYTDHIECGAFLVRRQPARRRPG